MSLRTLATGTLIADPACRAGAKGPFTTATIRVEAEAGEAILVSLIGFGGQAEQLLAHSKGDALAVGGRAKLTSWTGRDGEQKHGLSVVVESIATARPAPRQRAPKEPGDRAAPTPRDGGRPFDDDLSF